MHDGKGLHWATVHAKPHTSMRAHLRLNRDRLLQLACQGPRARSACYLRMVGCEWCRVSFKEAQGACRHAAGLHLGRGHPVCALCTDYGKNNPKVKFHAEAVLTCTEFMRDASALPRLAPMLPGLLDGGPTGPAPAAAMLEGGPDSPAAAAAPFSSAMITPTEGRPAWLAAPAKGELPGSAPAPVAPPVPAAAA